MADLKNEILHKTSWGFVEYIPAVPCLRCVIEGFSMSEEVRSRHDLLLQLLIEKQRHHQTIGLLIDPRKAEALLEADIEWLMNDWTPRVAQQRIRYLAVLIPDDEWARVSVDILQNNVDFQENSGVSHKYFQYDEPALTWLKNVLNNN
jgi:hypothetical protein